MSYTPFTEKDAVGGIFYPLILCGFASYFLYGDFSLLWKIKYWVFSNSVLASVILISLFSLPSITRLFYHWEYKEQLKIEKIEAENIQIELEEEAIRYANSPIGKREKLLEDLEDISGVSNKIARTLLDQFPTVESIKNASVQQLTNIPGVGENISKAIKARIG